MLDLVKTVIEIGLEKPLKVLHITDSHLALCDERDDERKQAIAAKKADKLESSLANLKEQIAYGEAHCDLILHTGDLIDFVSFLGVEFARNLLNNDKILFIAGNHEYSQYVGEAWEDMNYRMNSCMKMGPNGLGVNLFFTSRTVSGVNFVGIDDAYHQVEEWQIERLQMEVRKGLPVVLFMHAPLFEQSLYEKSIEFWKDGSAYLVGCDEEHLLNYSEILAMGQRPSETTKRFVEYVNGENQIKAVLAGHLHFNFESRLPGGTMQYVSGHGGNGFAREITIR